MNTNYMVADTRETIEGDDLIKLLTRHLNSFIKNDLETLMSDYTEQSVLMTHDATYNGLIEIKDFFTHLVVHFPKEDSYFELDKLVVKDDLGFIVWHANTPSLIVTLGTDTFIVRDEKIFRQTFAGQLNFID